MTSVRIPIYNRLSVYLSHFKLRNWRKDARFCGLGVVWSTTLFQRQRPAIRSEIRKRSLQREGKHFSSIRWITVSTVKRICILWFLSLTLLLLALGLGKRRVGQGTYRWTLAIWSGGIFRVVVESEFLEIWSLESCHGCCQQHFDADDYSTWRYRKALSEKPLLSFRWDVFGLIHIHRDLYNYTCLLSNAGPLFQWTQS